MNAHPTKQLLLLLLLFYNASQAQVVSKSLCDRYAPSVVARVYQYARQTKLTEAQQLKMAAFFQQADSLMVESIRHGKPTREVDNDHFTAYSKMYLDTWVEKINEIKKVPSPTIQKLKVQFYSRAEKDMYADWGGALLEAMQTVLPDTALFSSLYNRQIKKHAVTLAATERMNLIKEYHVSKDEFVPLVKLVEKKAYQQALIEYTYGGDGRKRDSLLLVVTKKCDSPLVAALLRNGCMMNTSQFAVALKYKQFLKLDPATVDTLLFHALYVNHVRDSCSQKDPFAKVDLKAYEAKWCNRLLTEDQYTKLLSLKNSGQAKNDANNDWENMEKRGITQGFDKKVTLDQLYRYYLQKWNAYNRYADDDARLEESLLILRDKSPEALKKLTAAKRQPKPANTNANAGLNLKW